MTARIDLTGQCFGRLTVASVDDRGKKNGDLVWRCVCVCGRVRFLRGAHLRHGRVRSCGCIKREQTVGCVTRAARQAPSAERSEK